MPLRPPWTFGSLPAGQSAARFPENASEIDDIPSGSQFDADISAEFASPSWRAQAHEHPRAKGWPCHHFLGNWWDIPLPVQEAAQPARSSGQLMPWTVEICGGTETVGKADAQYSWHDVCSFPVW